MHIDRIAPLAAGVLLALSGAAQAAATRTASFGVSATVAANCIVTAVPMPFGAYDGTAAIRPPAGLTVRCTKHLPYTRRAERRRAGSFAAAQCSVPAARHARLQPVHRRRPHRRSGATATAPVRVCRAPAPAWAGRVRPIPHTVYAELLNSLANQVRRPAITATRSRSTVTY